MSGMQNTGVDDVNVNPSVANALGGANASGSSTGNFGTGLAAAGSAYGIAQGIRSGTPSGYVSAGLGAGQLAAKGGAFGSGSADAGQALGAAGNVYGIYSGIKQGGAAGYGGAAVNAASLASSATGIGSAFTSGAGAAFNLYNEIKGYESGNTGKDAIQGAETGASIGTMILPGIGTLIGGVLGAAGGAIASTFGNGRVDPENQNFEGFTQAYNKAPDNQKTQLAQSVENPYGVLAGYFDLRSNQLKGDNPMYQSYGRAGEQKFTNDLVSQIQLGKSHGVTDPTAMYNQVIAPWVSSMGTWNDSNKGAMSAILQNMTGQIMSGTYKNNFKAIGGQQVFT